MCGNVCSSTKSRQFKNFEKELKELTKKLESEPLNKNRRRCEQFISNYSNNRNRFPASEFRKVRKQLKQFNLKFNNYDKSEAKSTNVNKQSEQMSSRYAEDEDLRKICQASSTKHPGETQNRKQNEAVPSTSMQTTQACGNRVLIHNNRSELPQVHVPVGHNNVDPCQNTHEAMSSKTAADNRLFSHNDRGSSAEYGRERNAWETTHMVNKLDGRKTGTIETVTGSNTETDGKDELEPESTQNMICHASQNQPWIEKMDTSEPPLDSTIIDIEKMDISEPPSPQGDMFSETSYSYQENRGSYFDNRYFDQSMDTTLKHTSVPDLDNNIFNQNNQLDKLNLSGYNKSRDVGRDEVDLKSVQGREYQENHYTSFQSSGQDTRTPQVERTHYDHRQESRMISNQVKWMNNYKQIEERKPGTSRHKYREENVQQRNMLNAVEDEERSDVSAERRTGAGYLAPSVEKKFQKPSSKDATETAAYLETNAAAVCEGQARQGGQQTKGEISYPHGGGPTQRAGYSASEQHKYENQHQPSTRQQHQGTQYATEHGSSQHKHSEENMKQKNTVISVEDKERTIASAEREAGIGHLVPSVETNLQTSFSKENYSVATEVTAYLDTNGAPVGREGARQGRQQTKAELSYPHGGGPTQRAGYSASEQHKDEHQHQPSTRQQHEGTQYETQPGTSQHKHSEENVKQKNTVISVEDKERTIASAEREAGIEHLVLSVDNNLQTPFSKEYYYYYATETGAYSYTNKAPINRERARQGRQQTKDEISYPRLKGGHIQRAEFLASEQHKDENHYQPTARQHNERKQYETEASYDLAVEAKDVKENPLPEVDNSPLKILDVHQYFRNDFDLKSLDDVDHFTRIERIAELAKKFEDPIQNFSEERHSLEYFIFDEKLMRFIENLDKIKSQDEAVTREKVQVIEYIKGLHNTLDERALDD